MLVRFAYLAVTHAFAALRLLPLTDREKDVEILALLHQLTALQRQLGDRRPQLRSEDRAFLAALLTPLARATLRRLRLLVSPDTVLRWHRYLVKRHHAQASRRRRRGRPRTVASVRRLVLRLAAENSSWGYRRIHGELALLGVTVAPSTVWEILKAAGVDPAPHRVTVTWAEFLRSQAEVVLAMDFVETVTVTGALIFAIAMCSDGSEATGIGWLRGRAAGSAGCRGEQGGTNSGRGVGHGAHLVPSAGGCVTSCSSVSGGSPVSVASAVAISGRCARV
ncbi:hypothetical protein [Lentzea atacamensis]|uniref:hypothetical protein n=1 Tax=Lentzea atacamensis TaxID=531938 RepID=UPI002D76648A|nr:hypothetical protein [Lentzea atacamensis]